MGFASKTSDDIEHLMSVLWDLILYRELLTNKGTFIKDFLVIEEVWDVPTEYWMKRLKYSREKCDAKKILLIYSSKHLLHSKLFGSHKTYFKKVGKKFPVIHLAFPCLFILKEDYGW